MDWRGIQITLLSFFILVRYAEDSISFQLQIIQIFFLSLK